MNFILSCTTKYLGEFQSSVLNMGDLTEPFMNYGKKFSGNGPHLLLHEALPKILTRQLISPILKHLP
jgi:hypothetical protein